MALTKQISLDDKWTQLNTNETSYVIQILGNYDIDIQYNTTAPASDDSMQLSPKDGLTSAIIQGTAYGRCKHGTGIVAVTE
jgi:hypothetical protein